MTENQFILSDQIEGTLTQNLQKLYLVMKLKKKNLLIVTNQENYIMVGLLQGLEALEKQH